MCAGSANNASFVYSRDTGDSDVFAQDPDTPEMIEEGKPSLGTDNGASEGAKDGNLSVDVSEGEQVESESEGDNQGKDKQTNSKLHACTFLRPSSQR